MLGPSGFFLPSGPENTDTSSNDLELIHTSKDGFNELYRICKNGRFFVYKALKKEYRGNPMYEDLLTKDFNIGFSLTHPGLCQYFAKISHPEIGNCIVMEWIDGCTLEELISSGHIDKMLAEKIICQICDALGYMHRRQVIHRDLKPENILVTHNGQNVKIIDFGLSDADSFAAFKAPAGTRIYASPELLAGEPIDNRSDIWSLGVIIGETHTYYRNVAARCLLRDREKRFASAEDVKKAVLNEGVRKLWKAVSWVAVCGVAAALTAGIIIRGFEPQQNADQSRDVQSAISGEVQMTVSSDTEAEVSGEAQAEVAEREQQVVAGEVQSEVSEQGQRLLETFGQEQQAAPEQVPGSEVSEQEADQSVISGQEQGLPEASEQSYTKSSRQSRTAEQGHRENTAQTPQAAETALTTSESQSSGQAASQSSGQAAVSDIARKDISIGKNATDLSTDFNSEPGADSSATDQPSSKTAAENIDTESLEDLFKKAAGQIL